MKRIILASASPRRTELMTQAGYTFTVKSAVGEEKTTETAPGLVVEELACHKAAEVYHSLSAEEQTNTVVIGADTVVTADGVILGKPADKEDARRMIRSLQGRTHAVCTGVVFVWQTANGEKKQHVFHEETAVTVYPMTEKEIEAYLSTDEPYDKAGAYAIQGIFAKHVAGIRGEYGTVVGLPIARLYEEWKKQFPEE